MASRCSRLLVLAAALACAGCSGVGLAYKHADRLMIKRLERFAALEPDQREALGAALEAGLERHRRDHLPTLISRLRETRGIVQTGIGRGEAERLLELAGLTYGETASSLIRDITPVLSSLGPEQIDELATTMAEEHARMAEERRDDRPGERAEAMIEGIEGWTGRLDADQRAIVREAEGFIPRRDELWLAYSRAQSDRLLGALRAGASPELIEQRLRAWWIEDRERDPVFRALTARARAGWIELLVRLDATLTGAQREKARAKLDSWIDGLEGVLRET